MSIEDRLAELRLLQNPSKETIVHYQKEWIQLNKEDAERRKKQEGEKA